VAAKAALRRKGGKVRVRTGVVLLTLSLVAAGCGSRLSDEQRLAALGGNNGSGGIAAGEGGDLGTGDLGTGDAGTTGDAGSGGAATGGATGSGGGGGTPGATTPKAPAGGNGGATDKGVTGTEITIAVLTDLTGPVPGIFRPSVDAVQAWANMINSKGGIHGRKIKVVPIDSKTNANDNRAGAIQACNQAFAIVGSMSAYDDGGAGPINDCGIPDLSATTVNQARDQARTTYPAYPNVAHHYILGPKKLMDEEHPGAKDTAAMLWLNASVAAFNAKKNMQAAESIGYKFVYRRQVEVVEPNYTPYVNAMRDANVQYVSMVGELNSMARLLKAFKSQGYIPKVREFDTAIYDKKFLAAAGDAAEGVFTSITATPLEEASGNAEYTLYINSLKRSTSNPPDAFFGLYAWSAARMFQEALEKTGPQITRQKLIAHLQGLHDWSAHGLHASHDIGGKKPANCFVMLRVQGGKFVRHLPKGGGFECNHSGVPLYNVRFPVQ
jgi:ABC-type branched-subunit amino acid transport system substrate-binding protein